MFGVSTIPNNLAIRCLVVIGIAGAFFAYGFVKGLQHSERDFMELQLNAWQQAYTLYSRMSDRVAAINQRTLQREAALVEGLKASQHHKQVLEHELKTRPTIERIQQVPVAGECPPCDVVDWGRFVCLSNFAKRAGPACNASDPGAADGLDEPVRPSATDPIPPP